MIANVENKTADLVGTVIVYRPDPFRTKIKTLTFENGKAFFGHSKIDVALGSTSYFARPFASWERGSKENFNGLLRQYLPKKRSLDSITDEQIKMIGTRLNNRRRKLLLFITPTDVFHQSLRRIELRH